MYFRFDFFQFFANLADNGNDRIPVETNTGGAFLQFVGPGQGGKGVDDSIQRAFTISVVGGFLFCPLQSFGFFPGVEPFIGGLLDGIGEEASFVAPWGIAITPDGRDLWVSDAGSRGQDQIRRIVLDR
mgnify:CR=1 FL=1